jgi:subtilase family serine protease
MKMHWSAALGAALSLGVCTSGIAFGQAAENASRTVIHSGNGAPVFPMVPSRVVDPIDETRLAPLTGNTHPMARAAFDKGLVDAQLPLERMQLVLKRSPEQEASLEKFMEEQQDPKSINYHHWLTAEEFGKVYGPSDADMAAVTSWLQNQGFRIDRVTKGRVHIEFSGTAGQVSRAFHTEIHNYLVNGVEHIANNRDPQVPEALAPVITGIASLHNFFPVHQSFIGRRIKMDRKTHKFSLADPPPPGKEPKPMLGFVEDGTYQFEEVTPFDFATIYNLIPLWNAGIDGSGMTVAISAASDITKSDVDTFRSSFGLPATKLTTIETGSDPGLVTTGAQGENTLDVEMSGLAAPEATVALVVSGSTQTAFGGDLSNSFIIDNLVAPVMSASYGQCELDAGTAGNASKNLTWQQASAEGISAFESSGDQGSAGCLSQDTAAPNATPIGVQVNGDASSPYVTAVGGTDLLWEGEASKYWNSTNASNLSNAKGYIPETVWNATCTSQFLFDAFFVPNYGATSLEQVCNHAGDPNVGAGDLIKITGGSGGESLCTTNSTTPTSTTLDASSCKGGYAKPSWQTGVTGIPADGHRDLPDVSLFAAGGFPDGIIGSAWLFCESQNGTNGCDYTNPNYIIYQETGGTSASSPAMAGIMTLIDQKTGSPQGLANPVLYKLASKETFANCKSGTVAATGSACVFYDITYGNNSQVCKTGSPDCLTSTSGDTYGILSGYTTTTGFDLATGLGSVNATNLANAWPSVGGTPSATLTPASLTFSSSAVGVKTAAQTVTLKNTNTGLTPLFIQADGLSISGTNYKAFGATTTCPANGTTGWSLAAGATCTISLYFDPTATGTATAQFSVYDNVGSSPQVVKLTGSVASGPPVVSLTPATLTFPSTKIGVSSAALPATLKNTGQSALTISSVTVSGTNGGSFTAASNCGASLAAGASCTISVTFKPAKSGALTAILSVADNAAGSPHKVTLDGTGAATAGITLTPTSIAFPATAEGNTSTAVPVTVKNAGTAAVTLDSFTFTGTNPLSFVDVNACGSSLAAGASCTVFVAFKPTKGGALVASLSVADTATGSPQTVALTGTGTTLDSVTLSPTSLAFGSVAKGTTSEAKSVTVTNAGTATLDLTGISITGLTSTDFLEISTCGPTLAPAASCVIDVAFKPASAATFSDTLSVSDNGTSSPQKVTLTGTGH